jgi:hypothetical protein
MSTEQKPSVGRIVHYVMPIRYGRARGEVRPAIIVRVFPGETDKVQLQVFTDGSNDGLECVLGIVWETSVHHDEAGKALGTWHWPPRV